MLCFSLPGISHFVPIITANSTVVGSQSCPILDNKCYDNPSYGHYKDATCPLPTKNTFTKNYTCHKEPLSTAYHSLLSSSSTQQHTISMRVTRNSIGISGIKQLPYANFTLCPEVASIFSRCTLWTSSFSI